MTEDFNKELDEINGLLVSRALKDIKCEIPQKEGCIRKAKCCGHGWTYVGMGILLGLYGFVIWEVLKYAFMFEPVNDSTPRMCNNIALVLIVVLVLTTLILVLAGVFFLKISVLHNEGRNQEIARGKCDTNERNMLAEKAVDDLKNNMLQYVIQDTLNSLKKK